MSERIDQLYAALEDGQCQLEVLADAYEDEGHELATGVRWLADTGRMPVWEEGGHWRWSLPQSVEETTLPQDLPRRFGEKPFGGLGSRHSRFVRLFLTLKGAIEAAAQIHTEEE